MNRLTQQNVSTPPEFSLRLYFGARRHRARAIASLASRFAHKLASLRPVPLAGALRWG